MIGKAPKNEYCPAAAEQVLAVAETYLANADRLIYSYGSRTFLSGYDLFDGAHEGRGNIDCSTFLLLVLAGIPYGSSPYAAGTAEGLAPSRAFWAQRDLFDFSDIPKAYVEIADRIGRPCLKSDRGLDLEKAAALGISAETLGEEIRRSGATRRSASIAEHFIRSGEAYSDPAHLRPGDIVFYRSARFFPGDGEAGAQVVHVGIAARATGQMINSSGTLSKERAIREGRPAVSMSEIFGRRKPAFFARPAYGRP